LIERSVTLRIARSDGGSSPRSTRDYSIEARPKMSVLDALLAVVEEQDASLAFRYSCRAGMCGSCAMRIDGRESLACRERLERHGPTITIEPLRSLPVIRDLLVDMTPFFAKYTAAEPAFTGADPSMVAKVDEPAVVPPGEHLRDVVNTEIDCISCGACYSACPVVAANSNYLGPAALNRAYALAADIRDATGPTARRAAVAGEDGIHACRSVGNCVAVCPAGVTPLVAIQLLRKRAIRP
jgi:succinate dehydrogenase/fumarate reductase iron-sulfur protein